MNRASVEWGFFWKVISSAFTIGLLVVALVLGSSRRKLQSSLTTGRIQCELNMECVWAAARSYAMAFGPGTNMLVSPVVLVPYLGRGAQSIVCPVSGIGYAEFLLEDGPSCLSGHELPKATTERWHLVFEMTNGRMRSRDLLLAARHNDLVVREHAVARLDKVFDAYPKECIDILSSTATGGQEQVRVSAMETIVRIMEKTANRQVRP